MVSECLDEIFHSLATHKSVSCSFFFLKKKKKGKDFITIVFGRVMGSCFRLAK